MFKKRLKQYCILRQKRRLGDSESVLRRSGPGLFSPRRVTNFFLKLYNPLLKSSGFSFFSPDISEIDKSYAVLVSGCVFWGP